MREFPVTLWDYEPGTDSIFKVILSRLFFSDPNTMSFRGRGGGGGGRGFGGRGGGRGGRGGGGFRDMGPPDHVTALGEMSHTCQDDLVVKVSQKDVPYFNAPIYLENKQQVRWNEDITFFNLQNCGSSGFRTFLKCQNKIKKTQNIFYSKFF